MEAILNLTSEAFDCDVKISHLFFPTLKICILEKEVDY